MNYLKKVTGLVLSCLWIIKQIFSTFHMVPYKQQIGTQ